MRLKKIIAAFMIGAMLLAVLPLSVSAANEQYPTVDLSFVRDTTDPTKGTLIIFSTNNIVGKFVYTAGIEGSSTSWTEVDLIPSYPSLVTLTGLPTNKNFIITYYTYSTYYSVYPSPTRTYTIPPLTGTSSGSHVSIYSSYRSGSDVLLAVNILEPCVFYYSDNGNMQNKSALLLLTTGAQNLTLFNFPSNVVYYYTESELDDDISEIKYHVIGSTGTGSGTTINYPRLTNYSLTNAADGTIKFSYTADKSGLIYYVISSTPVTSILASGTSTNSQYISAGNGSFSIDPYLFINEYIRTGTDPKMYFVTSDGYGNQSAVSSISVGSSSTTSGYPVLTNCSFVLTSTVKGTFSCTSDTAGTIFYTVATTSPGSSFYPTGSAQLQAGSNSFTIEDSRLAQSGAKIYFYTVGSSGNVSSVQSVSAGTATYPVLTNVRYDIVQSPLSYMYVGTLTFTSSAPGFIYFATSADTVVSKTSLTFANNAITQGTNTITINLYMNQLYYNTPLYFFTLDSSLNGESPLYRIAPNSSTVYPVSDSSPNVTVISSAEIKNVVAPSVGASPSPTYSTSDTKYTIASCEWYDNTSNKNVKLGTGDKFQPGCTYSVVVTLNAKQGYSFPTSPTQFTATVNGKSATLVNYTASTVTLKYTFDALPAADIKTIQINDITDPVAGNSPDTSGTPANSSYYITSLIWNPTTTRFEAGKTYTLQITLAPVAGNRFNVESAKIGYRSAKIESKSSDRVVISYTYWVNPFPDVPEYDVEPSAYNPDGVPNRYYVFIKYCYLNNLFKGNDDGTFRPNDTMTRGMFVTVLGRLAGLTESMLKSYNTTTKFKDVDKGAYYAPYVAWATQNNILQGYTNGNFGPSDPITREQMCELLRRYAVYAGIPLRYSARQISFPDASKVSDYAKAAVSIFEQAGVALPRPNSTNFDPKEHAQRKEIAEMLILFMMKYMDD